MDAIALDVLRQRAMRGHWRPWSLRICVLVVVASVGGLGGCTRASTGEAQPPAVAPSQPASPDAGSTASAGVCARHVSHLREQQCGDEPEDVCTIDEFPCDHSLDFDGDGAADRVELIALDGDGIGLRVVFGDGREALVGDAPLALSEIGEPDDVGRTLDPDLSWLASWTSAPRGPGGLEVRGHSFEIPQASGDGLLLSGSDAAAILVLASDGWQLIELGY